jgi:lysophospholipase L1-like esterase
MQTNLNPKRILIYGDSLTFARIPGKFVRFDEHTRWPCVLQLQLGNRYEIIEEGLRARMLKGENPFINDRDGYKQFGPILASHLPLDLLIIFLGTNDACGRAHKSPTKIAHDLESYFPLLKNWCDQQHMPLPEVLIVAPPFVNESALEGPIYVGAEHTTRELPELYESVALEKSVLFFDSSKVASSSLVDGVHLDADAHLSLGKAMADHIQNHFA